VGVYGDRCVVRGFSPLRTVAGGVLLNPLGVDMRRRSAGFAERCAMLAALAQNPPPPPEERVLIQLLCSREAAQGVSFPRLRVLANLDSKALDKALAALSSAGKALCFDRDQRLYVADALLAAPSAACVAEVAVFHKKYGERQGIRRSELVSGWGKAYPPKLAHVIIERLVKKGALVAEGEFLRLPAHKAAFSKEQAPLGEALLKAHRDAGLSPPNTNDLLTELGISKKEAAPILAALRASGELVRVAEGVWYAAEHLEAAEAAVRKWFEDHESIDLADLKSITGLSRKYLVALLEYFDANRITIRVGDKRMLRQ
jgi:selenocysteine-specific elongation factor